MTLQDLANLGEIIGAIAVVVSLVYLAIQIRQNTVQIRENSQISRLLLQENFVSGQEGLFRAPLTNEEMYQARSIEPLEHKRCLIQIDRFAEMPAFRSWWSRQRAGFEFDSSFVNLIDDRIKKIESEDQMTNSMSGNHARQ